MSREDRWCESANQIVIDFWRYARRLGRTTAERMAVFNVEMERLQRHRAGALRAHAKRRRTFTKSAMADLSSRGRKGAELSVFQPSQMVSVVVFGE
jgi:hypothetical protein